MKRKWRLLLSSLAAALLLQSPAYAAAGIAGTVLSELSSLVVPAIALGVIWLGILIMSGRATVLAFLTFLIGVAICLAGGFW